MINANDPSLNSWIEVPAGSDFPIQNLPFGIFRTESNPAPGFAPPSAIMWLIWPL